MLNVINAIGVVAFACSGVFKGLKYKFDIFGITVLGVSTACGGGIIRDLLLNKMPTAISNPNDVYLSIFSSIFIYMIVKIQEKRLKTKTIDNSKLFMRLVKVSDALGLSLFTITGASIAVNNNLGILSVAIMATLTGVGGGMIRDILVNETPFVLKEDIYATLCFAGGIIYYFFVVKFSFSAGRVVPLLLIGLFFIRIIAIKYKLSLHFSGNSENKNK